MPGLKDDGLPFFSVIVATYNSTGTISRCLNSVLQQTYRGFEVIVIDGLSQDDTVVLVENLNNYGSQIRLLSEKDRGIYDAMNKGIDLARGKWLFFLGSDDILFDDTVLRDVKNMIDKAPKSRFVYGNVFTSMGYMQKFDNFSFARLTEKNICHQAIFYHVSLFRDERYDIRFRLLADWDFNLKVFRSRNFPKYIDRAVAIYNMDGQSAGWLQGEEYKRHFSNRRVVFLKHRGRVMYFGYLLSYGLWRVKRKVQEALKKALVSGG